MTYEAIVSQCGHFYVCGDVSMANDVTKTLEHILCQYGDMNPNQAKNFVLKMKVISAEIYQSHSASHLS